nr:MAG TPA: hypothetical protein [Caudoviricetes sp.]
MCPPLYSLRPNYTTNERICQQSNCKKIERKYKLSIDIY